MKNSSLTAHTASQAFLYAGVMSATIQHTQGGKVLSSHCSAFYTAQGENSSVSSFTTSTSKNLLAAQEPDSPSAGEFKLLFAHKVPSGAAWSR